MHHPPHVFTLVKEIYDGEAAERCCLIVAATVSIAHFGVSVLTHRSPDGRAYSLSEHGEGWERHKWVRGAMLDGVMCVVPERDWPIMVPTKDAEEVTGVMLA